MSAKKKRSKKGAESETPRSGPQEGGPQAPPEETLGEQPAEPQAAEQPQAERSAQAPPAARTPKADDLLRRLQRTTADYLNYQRRMERRIEEVGQYAVQELVLDLLPVIDNFERALAAAEVEPDFQAFLEGVRLVHGQLLGAMTKHGVAQIDAAGKPFDPERHEAVAHLPSDQCPEGHVAEVIQTGYCLRGRTLRASRVAVSSGKREQAESPASEPSEAPPESEPEADVNPAAD